jgi:hypothetical protein
LAGKSEPRGRERLIDIPVPLANFDAVGNLPASHIPTTVPNTDAARVCSLTSRGFHFFKLASANSATGCPMPLQYLGTQTLFRHRIRDPKRVFPAFTKA